MAAIDADLLEELVEAARRYEADIVKANREARRG